MGCGGFGRGEPHQGVVDLAQQGGHSGLLGQDAGEKVGERWSFLFGPFRGQDLDHMGDLARQGFELALEGLAVFKKSVLGVIHFFEEFADADEIVGDSAEAASLASWPRAMRMSLPSVRVGLASVARRLTKLVCASSSAAPGPWLYRARQGPHLVTESFDVENRAVCARGNSCDGRA